MRWSEVCAMRRSFLTLHKATPSSQAWGHYVIDPQIGAAHEDKHARRHYGPPKSGADDRLAPDRPRGRVLDLPPFLVELLIVYVEAMGERDLLFPNRKGEPRQHDGWNNLRWRPACDGWEERIGPKTGRVTKHKADPVHPTLRFHDLKHTHKAMLNDLGVHTVMQDYRLGHKTPGVQGVYSHRIPEMRATLVAGLQQLWLDFLDKRESPSPFPSPTKP
jgi:integrase